VLDLDSLIVPAFLFVCGFIYLCSIIAKRCLPPPLPKMVLSHTMVALYIHRMAALLQNGGLLRGRALAWLDDEWNRIENEQIEPCLAAMCAVQRDNTRNNTMLRKFLCGDDMLNFHLIG
jgi:hypothetical protein